MYKTKAGVAQAATVLTVNHAPGDASQKIDYIFEGNYDIPTARSIYDAIITHATFK